MEITKLKPNEIFVFGSNLAGRHGIAPKRNATAFGALTANSPREFDLAGRSLGLVVALNFVRWVQSPSGESRVRLCR